MPDVVLWVLKRLEDDPLAAEEFKKEVPFRRATALVATSRSESSAARRAEIYEQASREIDAFLKETPEGERAIQAYLQKGNLLIERGRAKVEESKRPGQDAKKLRAEALPFFAAAIKVLEGPVRKEGVPIEAVENAEDAVLKLLRRVDESLKDMRGEGTADKPAADKPAAEKGTARPAQKAKKPVRKPGSAKIMADLEDRQDELRALLLKTRLLIAAAYYEKSRALEPASKEWEATLAESAKQYKELYEKYRTRGAGLFARYYEGRNYVVLGKRKEALAALADIRMLDGEGIVPGLRAKAINSSLECWLADKQYEAFDERLQKLALAPLAPDRMDSDWLGMKYRSALLLERRAAAIPDKEQSKRAPLLRDAKRLAMEVAKVNRDFNAESKALLAELGKQLPEDFDDVAATFESALDAARASLVAMQTRAAEFKQAEAGKNTAAMETARKDEIAERIKTIKSLRKAMPLAGPDDLDGLNQARSLLVYMLYADQRLHEAAALGEFLLERYPSAKGSQQAARIAMASWQQLQKQSVAAWADEAKAKCVETAQAIMRTWPDRPEAADAAVIAIAAATEERDPDKIVAIAAQVPAGSPRRPEVLLRAGGALWREVQEKSRLDESARPTAATLSGWRVEAGKALDEGLVAMAGTGPTAVGVAAALARAQMAMDDGDNKKVAALLEQPQYGPWTVLNGKDQAFTHGPLATATATASLRYFIETEQNDKAVQAMKKLEELAGAAGAEASAKLTSMYQSMGRDLQAQLTNLASGPTAGTPQAQARSAAILAGFEKFLEGVAKDPKLSSQMWAATTYLNLGAGEGTGSVVPKSKANGYLDRAATIYEGLLSKGDAEIAKFEPSIRLKMASVYREREKWDEAQKQIDWILSDKKRQNTLDFQIQAAELLAEAAAKTADKAQQAAFYGRAISGYKQRTANGEVYGWGWAVISNRLETQAFSGSDEKALEARRKFFKARLSVVKCRMEKAEALKSERDRELQKAFDYVDITYKMHPDLGGPDTSKQFDKLLKEIEKRQSKPPLGIDGLKQAAAAG